MKLKGLMEEAYRGRVREKKRLEERRGEFLLGFEDLAARLKERPKREEVELLAPQDGESIRELLMSASPRDKKEGTIWGYLTSIAAERLPSPLVIPPRNYAGLELAGGTLILDGGTPPSGGAEKAPWRRAHHLGERMSGGRLVVLGGAGDYLGQEMRGGGIVALSCGDYAFRKMAGGWGVVRGAAGNYLAVGNSGGRVVVKGGAGARSGWLMRSGRIRIGGDAGEYLGLMMRGGEISVGGGAGARAGWRMKGGLIEAGDYGPEAGAERVGGRLLRREDL
ncbi:formylmethanofuran dehydrogenase subunit C [Methanothrix harundinacea]|uniref:Formylmethanofuran dehydrogenase, subunit C n=1 Tax=Methanothrix harundinacea (strain 6Ac) TaxID=1110509 RepID=G7WPI8_METH6|nr:formylmethanofuran dehydrogenase subunit C [Methanothrix harundinacea]AET65189.1 Formylmethanofuran dehydrogenase, subunit C [Methanothrix harundinacea 6Ac]